MVILVLKEYCLLLSDKSHVVHLCLEKSLLRQIIAEEMHTPLQPTK